MNCYFAVASAVSADAGKISAGDSRRYNRHDRKESERFKSFTYEELTKRDKVNLDIFWLKDENPEDSANRIIGQRSEVGGQKDQRPPNRPRPVRRPEPLGSERRRWVNPRGRESGNERIKSRRT